VDRTEIDWLRRAHHADTAILSVGFGEQTLALGDVPGDII